MRRIVFCLLPLLLTAGCARVVVDGEIRPDGTFARQLTFSGGTPEPGKKESDWKKRFTFQKTAGWTLRDAKDELTDGPAVIARREFPLGTLFEGDITINNDEGRALVRNAGRVTRRDDGNFEYTETFRWLGKRDIDETARKNLRTSVVAALPAGTDVAKIDAVTAVIPVAIMDAIFGPNQPAADIVMSSPHQAVRRIKSAVHKRVRPLVGSDADAAKVAALVVTPDKASPASASAGDQESAGATSVLVSLRVPGQLLETNGIREDDGTLMWRFYGEASTFKDVTLRAVFRP